MAKAIDATVEGIEGTIVGFRGSRDSRIAHLCSRWRSCAVRQRGNGKVLTRLFR